jgi:hypothetical protein
MDAKGALSLIREMGSSWVYWRGLYEAEVRSGFLKARLKAVDVDSVLGKRIDFSLTTGGHTHLVNLCQISKNVS